MYHWDHIAVNLSRWARDDVTVPDEPLPVPVCFHDLAHRGGEVVTGGFEVRVDGQRAPEEIGGLAVLTQGDVAKTLTRQRPEVVGLARESLLAIRDGRGVVFSEVSHRRALVPAL